MNDNIKIESIIELVLRHTLYRPETLSLNTRIGEDLLILGDDAHDLLIEFSKEFSVDLSDMYFDDYFPSEASSAMKYYLSCTAKGNSKNIIINSFKLLDCLFRRVLTKRVVYKTLTINDLVYAAKIGIWKVQDN